MALLVGLIAALVGVPLWSLGRIAADAGLAGIWRALSAPGSRVAVIHTVTVAAAVTVLAVTGGTALALAVERQPGRSRRTARLLVAGPLLIRSSSSASRGVRPTARKACPTGWPG